MAKRLNGQLVNPIWVVIGGIIALLIVYLTPLFLKKAGKKIGVIFSRKAIRTLLPAKTAKEVQAVIPGDIKRDPFLPSYMRLEARPSGVVSSQDLGFSLSGIVWDPQKPMAIIDGEIRYVGEVINGKKISEIRKDRVIFTEGGATYIIMMGEQ